MNTHYFQCETKSVERLPDGKTVRVKGFASTPDLDRHADIVLPEAFIKTMNDYKSRKDAPAILRGHNPDYVAGKMVMEGSDAPVISEKGLFIAADIDDAESADDAMAGRLRTFSIGYIPIKSDFQMRPTGRIDAETGQELFQEARILKELDLVEVSLVSTPANPNALFTVTKSLKKMFHSIPSPTMKIKCDVCESEEACGRVGTRFIGKACIEKMQFKSEEVKAIEPEKKDDGDAEGAAAAGGVDGGGEGSAPASGEEGEDATPAKDGEPNKESDPSKPESSGESPEGGNTEEVKPEGEQEEESKVVVSKEDKERITAAAKKFSELDAATVAEVNTSSKKKSTEAKTKVDVTIDMKGLGDIFQSLSNVLSRFDERMKSIESVLSKTPVYKGKSIMAFNASKQVVKDPKEKKETPKGDDGFVSMLKAAKGSNTRVVLGSGDPELDGEE